MLKRQRGRAASAGGAHVEGNRCPERRVGVDLAAHRREGRYHDDEIIDRVLGSRLIRLDGPSVRTLHLTSPPGHICATVFRGCDVADWPAAAHGAAGARTAADSPMPRELSNDPNAPTLPVAIGWTHPHRFRARRVVARPDQLSFNRWRHLICMRALRIWFDEPGRARRSIDPWSIANEGGEAVWLSDSAPVVHAIFGSKPNAGRVRLHCNARPIGFAATLGAAVRTMRGAASNGVAPRWMESRTCRD
jgi:hypothetical protein